MRMLAAWCVQHRKLVVLLWLATLAAVSAVSLGVGSAYSNTFTLPNTESWRALQLLRAASPKVAGDTEQVVWETKGALRVTDPSVQRRITTMLSQLERLPHVTAVVSPYSAQTGTRINASRTVAFAQVTFDRQAGSISAATASDMVRVVRSAQEPGLEVGVTGQVAAKAVPLSAGGVEVGVALAAVVLVLGSLPAMLLPIVSAMGSLGSAVGIIGLASHAMKMPDFSTQLVLLIGLGVGVDYALFIVTRHRQGLIAGRAVADSIVTAVDTSGRAVLFAGVIVCIALLGMFALGITFLYGMAVAAAIGVGFTMIAALTLLPALLGFMGPRILSRRQRRMLAEQGPAIVGTGRSGFWARWSDLVQRQPLLPAIAAAAAIVTLAVPALSIRLGTSDQGNDPRGTATRQAFDMLARGFGKGFNGPLELVVTRQGPIDPAVVTRLVDALRAQPGVARVAPPLPIPTRDGAGLELVLAYPTTSPQSAATSNLIAHLRQQTIPAVLSGSRTTVLVGGATAIFVDFAHALSAKLPLFIGVVVLLSFVLLAAVFRSLMVPVTAAVMNLLSIAAAFGMVVAVFQWGWLGTLIGADQPGPVDAFLPVMLFAILFGLSMDYEVFLVTRMHEEWLTSHDNQMAVHNGLAATGKTITAAAFIMILVFASFLLGGMRIIKEFGIGLAGGVLVDALVIRMAIVPALMQLLRRSNWWFPRWLDRILPHLSVEPEVPPPPAVQDHVPVVIDTI